MLSFTIPGFDRRHSQPPSKERLTGFSGYAMVPTNSSRSRSIGVPRRRRPQLTIVDEPEEDGPIELVVEPQVVEIKPKRTSSAPQYQLYNSLPRTSSADIVEISPRRGRQVNREQRLSVLPGDLSPSSTFCSSNRHYSYDYQPRREASSDSNGRHIIVERSRSRQPSLLLQEPIYEDVPSRSVSRASRGQSAAPVLHQSPERARSRHRRSLSRQSRMSETSGYSSVQSDAESTTYSAATSSTGPSVTGSPEISSKFAFKLEKLDTVCEPPEEDATSPKTRTTRYKYRYTPVEKDYSSVKAFVRELERGRSRHLAASAASVSKPTEKSIVAESTEKLADGAQEHQGMHGSGLSDIRMRPLPPPPPPSPPRRGHGRSFSHSHVSTRRRSPSIARSAESTDAPPMRRAYSVAPSTTSYASSSSSPARREGPKFAERFSVCLDGSTATYTPSDPGSWQDAQEERRMRRMKRVIKMAEYAAGRR